VRSEEVANREAEARGWNLDMVEGLMQDLDGSTCGLLRDADRVLQVLAEEDKARLEERAAYYATCLIRLAGVVFKVLDKRRWSRRDCLEG
jgi:hypothetical protein